jgi:L-2-hydroxyglutarate oxidase LhgO
LTGIIDSHAYMLALLGDIENAGGTLVFNTRVDRGWISRGYPVIEAHNEGEVLSLSANHIFNCAGLEGDRLAREFSGINSRVLPRYSYAKGNYFTYMDASPFSSLIYPIPDQHGLGIHVTLDMAGRIRFGPDVEWIDQINYEIDAGRRTDFARAIRQYWPDCDEERLVPAYSGIRPKINGRGASSADFLVQSESDHGVPGLINLFGIESPGLTSSLALADYVRDLCAQRPNS